MVRVGTISRTIRLCGWFRRRRVTSHLISSLFSEALKISQFRARCFQVRVSISVSHRRPRTGTLLYALDWSDRKDAVSAFDPSGSWALFAVSASPIRSLTPETPRSEVRCYLGSAVVSAGLGDITWPTGNLCQKAPPSPTTPRHTTRPFKTPVDGWVELLGHSQSPRSNLVSEGP